MEMTKTKTIQTKFNEYVKARTDHDFKIVSADDYALNVSSYQYIERPQDIEAHGITPAFDSTIKLRMKNEQVEITTYNLAAVLVLDGEKYVKAEKHDTYQSTNTYDLQVVNETNVFAMLYQQLRKNLGIKHVTVPVVSKIKTTDIRSWDLFERALDHAITEYSYNVYRPLDIDELQPFVPTYLKLNGHYAKPLQALIDAISDLTRKQRLALLEFVMLQFRDPENIPVTWLENQLQFTKDHQCYRDFPELLRNFDLTFVVDKYRDENYDFAALNRREALLIGALAHNFKMSEIHLPR